MHAEKKNFELHGITVVLTRNREASETTAQKVLLLGGVPLIAPLISVHFLEGEYRDSELTCMANYQGIIATSANAVRGLQLRLDRHVNQKFSESLPPLYGVGQATVQAAEKLGWPIRQLPGVKDSLSLAHAIVSTPDLVSPPARFIWPHGQMADTRWLSILNQAGCSVHELLVYRTDTSLWSLELRNHLLTLPKVAVLLFSPSAVFALQQSDPEGRLQSRNDTLFACIGKTTMQSAQDRGLQVAAVAKHPTDTELLSAVIAAIQQGFW
ncbi:uroporphyrinogen-III synthase [Alicyclobacillaceae bacterium I2511]|nr:uroporphyrinogen-III synthase [Alicyclobacillaceae bacterium I2511]